MQKSIFLLLYSPTTSKQNIEINHDNDSCYFIITKQYKMLV